MTKSIIEQSKQNLLIISGFIVFCFVTTFTVTSAIAFWSGLGISLINAGIYWGMLARHLKRIPVYPAQALVVVVTTTIMRFLVVSALLIGLLTQTALSSTTILLGFVAGQIFFWIYQLKTVSTNNGK